MQRSGAESAGAGNGAWVGAGEGRELGSVTLQAPSGEAAFATRRGPVGCGPGRRGLLCPEVRWERSGGPRSGRPRTASEVPAKPPEDRPGPPSDLPTRESLIPARPGVVSEAGTSPSFCLSGANTPPGCWDLGSDPPRSGTEPFHSGLGRCCCPTELRAGRRCWKRHALVSNSSDRDSLRLRI